MDAKPSEASRRGHSDRSAAVIRNGDLIRVGPYHPVAAVEKVVEKIRLRMLMVTIVKNIPSTAFMLTGLLVGLLPETWSSKYLGRVTLLGSIPGSHGQS